VERGMTVLLDPGGANPKYFEAAIHFAQQLRSHNVNAVLPATALPEKAPRLLRYEAVNWLANENEIEFQRVIVLNCNQVSAPSLARLQSIYAHQNPKLIGVGCFSNQQAQIIVQAKLAYAAGIEPKLYNLNDYQLLPLVKESPYILLGNRSLKERHFEDSPKLTLCLMDDAFELPHFEGLLGMIVHDPKVQCTILVSSSHYKRAVKLTSSRVRVMTFGEAQPHIIADMSDILCVVGRNAPGGRVAAAALDTLMSGGVVVDATETGAYSHSDAPVVRAPFDMAAIILVLKETLLPSLFELGRTIRQSAWVSQSQIQPFLEEIFGESEDACTADAKSEILPKTSAGGRTKTLFIPTNGVGLGHAQRSALIATELEKASSAHFAAFPSCVPMLRGKGFQTLPLVSKSDAHNASYANDLLNYTRLKGVLQSGDHIVFDGAYIFDSILRVIREKGLSATWIRRGLWQPGQVDRMPLEREHDFTNVIVPDEAFTELNTAYTYGSHIHRVPPIVQIDKLKKADRKKIRSHLFKRFYSNATKILVTMLGGGVAADREMQLQTLCALCEARDDVLHLIVVWPQGVLSPSLTGWQNSHVVRSQKALTLAQASDLTVSAVGYNSFHEFMYHQIPSVLVPQMAGYMDDQARRAEAAAKRGLCIVLEDADNLFTLRKEVTRLLEEGATEALKSAFSEISLPEVGNRAAAKIIESSMR
jgi:UDP:flavonoid glycosyltransferase YjiC (YdhE family)